MQKRFDTLDKEFVSLAFHAARLVDARDAGDATAVAKLQAVRARRDVVLAELRRRDPNYDRSEY